MAAAAAVKTFCRPYDDDDDDDIDMDPDATTTTTPLSSTPPSSAPQPLLSILNVVVDHVMMSPSPLEPKEFTTKAGQHSQEHQQLLLQPDSDERIPSLLSMATKNSYIRVPILRVFGPVLKDGDCSHYIHHNDGIDDDGRGAAVAAAAAVGNSTREKLTYRQPQSGCLHIHGAYPYMLARPVVAGPDGSMYPPHHRGHPNNHKCMNYFDRIDWDDAYSVVTILEEIHFRLEMALRVSYEHHHGNNSNNKTNSNANNIGPAAAAAAAATSSSSSSASATANNHHDNNRMEEASKNTHTDAHSSSQHPSSPTMPLFIRRVTIVIGRGFYTYCPGPAAPFLRVEYYDPSMRWRVKMILERGLELNEMYHPDPARYDYEDILGGGGEDENGRGGNSRGVTEGIDTRPLKFRCYEAHIPYTMQVFKDYNLAGMKYIKVGSARFRNPLPRTLRKRTREEFSIASKNDHPTHDDTDTKDDAYFFSHLISKELFWPQLDDAKRVDGASLDEHWLRKQSSCDLEFDCTVEQLLDVLDVMTELPQNPDERQKVHWRAVPSLREIWEQERKRMSVLLPPENDFLSGFSKEDDFDNSDDDGSSENSIDDDNDDDVIEQMNNHASTTPQFTLNVKKGASVPGTRLAVKGIKQLFQTSVGLEADFRRALRDIVLRHERFIDDVDGGVNGGGVLTNTSSTDTSMFSPDLNEGIEALAALCDQFSQGVADVKEDSLAHINAGPETESNRSMKSNLHSWGKYEPAPLSQKDADDEIEMLTFGQQVDYGDVHSSLFAPHDDSTDLDEEDDDFLDEEERLGEKGFEMALTQLATQTVEPGSESVSLFDSYEEESHVDMSHGYSHLPYKNDEIDLFSDDDGDNALHMKEEGPTLSVLSQSSEEDSSTIEHVIFEECIPTTLSLSQASGDGFSQSQSSELPTGSFVAIPRKSHELRCGEITHSSATTFRPWHTLPSVQLETCPPWFNYRWTSPGAPPLFPSSHIEPVKRPPSFSQVQTWVRFQKRTEVSHNCKTDKQEKVNLGKADRIPPCLTAYTQYSQLEESTVEESPDPLAGLGHQGGRVQVSAGGGMKTQINTSTTYTPLTIMSIEVHVQCRIKTGPNDQNEIAMVPDSSRDAIFAVAYVYCCDPGGGESLGILEKGCVLVTTDLNSRSNIIIGTMGLSSGISVERVNSESSLLLRIASIVKQKDPDALVSWDTQGGGLGFLVERGVAIGRTADGSTNATQIDMARLLGRTPRVVVQNCVSDIAKVACSTLEGDQQQSENDKLWNGSGLGGEWDDMVGAGTAAASIVSRTVVVSCDFCFPPFH